MFPEQNSKHSGQKNTQQAQCDPCSKQMLAIGRAWAFESRARVCLAELLAGCARGWLWLAGVGYRFQYSPDSHALGPRRKDTLLDARS